jgi:hypothetical protein
MNKYAEMRKVTTENYFKEMSRYFSEETEKHTKILSWISKSTTIIRNPIPNFIDIHLVVSEMKYSDRSPHYAPI